MDYLFKKGRGVTGNCIKCCLFPSALNVIHFMLTLSSVSNYKLNEWFDSSWWTFRWVKKLYAIKFVASEVQCLGLTKKLLQIWGALEFT